MQKLTIKISCSSYHVLTPNMKKEEQNQSFTENMLVYMHNIVYPCDDKHKIIYIAVHWHLYTEHIYMYRLQNLCVTGNPCQNNY